MVTAGGDGIGGVSESTYRDRYRPASRPEQEAELPWSKERGPGKRAAARCPPSALRLGDCGTHSLQIGPGVLESRLGKAPGFFT